MIFAVTLLRIFGCNFVAHNINSSNIDATQMQMFIYETS